MRDPERESTSPKKAAEADAPSGKERRGNHSRPLDELASTKKREAGTRSHARRDEGGKKETVAETAEDKHDAPSENNASAKDAEASKPERSVIVPDEVFEPQSMVDTSANKMQVKQRQVFRENPNIYYMNGESLSRPLTLPPSAKVGIIIIIAVAAVLASGAFYLYFDATTNEPAREQARMQEQLDRGVTLDLPDLLSMLEVDDATIDAQLKATGATFFERAAVGSGEDYEIVKLPADVSLVDAAAMYASGVSKLTPSQAATLLNGSWDLLVSRSNGLDISLHYADFKSGSEDAAIANAIAAENLERGDVVDSGDNDGYGNHFTQGTIMINGVTYTWTVSSLALKDVYSIKGLPDDAVYVGIRIKGAAE